MHECAHVPVRVRDVVYVCTVNVVVFSMYLVCVLCRMYME